MDYTKGDKFTYKRIYEYEIIKSKDGGGYVVKNLLTDNESHVSKGRWLMLIRTNLVKPCLKTILSKL